MIILHVLARLQNSLAKFHANLNHILPLEFSNAKFCAKYHAKMVV